MYGNRPTKCPLCGNDYIFALDKECDLCHSGPRKLGNLSLGWVYRSEWQIFEENLGSFRLFKKLKLFELYGYIYRWYKKIPHEEIESRMPLRTQIVLWGPASSGKTWLLYAFLKKITEWRRISRAGNSFNFRLVDIDGEGDIDITKGPPLEGTMGITEKRFWYKKTNSMSALRNEVNTHVHELLAIDDRGDDQVPGSVSEADLNMTQAFRKGPGMASLRRAGFADAIFLLVDLDMARTPEVFKSFLSSLEALWESSYDYKLEKKRKLAICVPKIDQHGLRYIGIATEDKKKNFEKIVEEKFGNKAPLLFTAIEEFNRLNFEVDYFFVSSCGYRNGIANYDKSKGQIANLDEWSPEGVHEPFFWAFDTIERARIMNNNHLFQMFVKGNIGEVCNKREEQYIPYSDIVKMAQEFNRR